MEKKTKKLLVNITEDQYKKLEMIKEQTDRFSVAEVVRSAILEYYRSMSNFNQKIGNGKSVSEIKEDIYQEILAQKMAKYDKVFFMDQLEVGSYKEGSMEITEPIHETKEEARREALEEYKRRKREGKL